MIEILELSDQEFDRYMINIIRTHVKSGQHARTEW